MSSQAAHALGKKQNLRVAVVVGTLFDAQLNGWRACRQAGLDLSVVGTCFNPYREEWPWESQVPAGIPTVTVEPFRLRPRKSSEHLWWLYPRLRRALGSLQPEIVHIRSEPWTPLTLHVLLLKRLRAIRGKVVVHGDEFTYWHGRSPKRLLRRAVLRAALAQLDGYACINSMGADLVREHGLRTDAPAVALPGIVPDLERFRPASDDERRALREKLGLPLDKIVVGFVGRLEPEKGVLDLVAAASALESPDVFVAAWGSGSLEARVRASLGERPDGRFLGPLDLSQVADAMRASDIIVVPSRASWNEQFGRVAVEAMACSCAVVATRSGALGEVVGDGGVLVDPDDVPALAGVLHALASDRDLRLTLGARARARAVRLFAPEAVARTAADFWSAVAGRC